ncbi:MAG: hypothetical protein Q8O55_07395 [Dehalococcoidales bacterium]|nr:hypothetical protein [Dehalococcoidales bacterium]
MSDEQEETEEEETADGGDDEVEGNEEEVTAAAPASESIIEVKAEEPAAAAAPVAVKPKADELKIVIVIKDNRATIGVQAPDCDPVFETAEGDLSEILAHSHIAVDNARAKWATSKRNPKADLPAPPAPAPRPASTSSTSSRSTATKTKVAAAAPKAQPKFF